MALLDRLFGRSNRPPELDVGVLLAWFGSAVARQGEEQTEPALVRARLADRCRDAGLRPLLPEEFESLSQGLDTEAWRRLALLVGALDLDAVRAALPALAAVGGQLSEVVGIAFVNVARGLPLLTLDLLRQGPLRVEEMARRFLAALGVTIRGESAQVSSQRLERLDYERLLAEAERAKQAAEERMNELRRLQEEQEQRRPRRGKW